MNTNKKLFLSLVILITALFGIELARQWSIFTNAQYGFHDLGLITDMIANTFFEGEPFYILDYSLDIPTGPTNDKYYGPHHLKMHFTPSLLVLLPFLVLFNSQFVLLAASVLSQYFALGIMLWLLIKISEQRKIGLLTTSIFSLILIDFNLFSIFSKNVRDSAHFEILFAPFAILSLYFFHTKRLLFTFLFLLLALGVRQDAGIFLAFIFSLYFLKDYKYNFTKYSKKLYLGIISFSLVTPFIITKLFLINHSNRLWAHYGSTYKEIIKTFIKKPLLTYDLLSQSAFTSLNREALFIGILDPVSYILANIPGILYFTTSSHPRRILAYYNSALILPLFSVFLIFLAPRISDLSKKWRPLPILILILLLGNFGYRFIAKKSPSRTYQDYFKAFEPNPSRMDHSLIAELRELCGEGITVAADFNTFTLLPIDWRKITLRHYEKADLVFFHIYSLNVLSGFPHINNFRDAIHKNGSFRVFRQSKYYRSFIRKDSHKCVEKKSEL